MICQKIRIICVNSSSTCLWKITFGIFWFKSKSYSSIGLLEKWYTKSEMIIEQTVYLYYQTKEKKLIQYREQSKEPTQTLESSHVGNNSNMDEKKKHRKKVRIWKKDALLTYWEQVKILIKADNEMKLKIIKKSQFKKIILYNCMKIGTIPADIWTR